MKAVFFHGAKLKYDEGTKMYYTSGGLNKQFLSKYLKYFDNITLVTRKVKLKEEERQKVGICSGKNIFFSPIENFNTMKLLLGKYNKKIEQEITKNEFVIVRMPSFISVVAMHYAIKLHKNYMVEMVGCPWDAFWNYGNIKGKVIAPIMYIITKYYLKKAKNVIYVSNEFLQKRYPNNHNNIGCSDVNLLYIDEKKIEERIQKIHNKSNDEKVKLGLIGSLDVNFKGHRIAIKALKLLNNDNIELHFLGSGKKERWEKLAKKYSVEKQVYFDGTLPGGEKVYQWMDELDLYLIPSLQEGLPRALVEAMSRACPVIGANTGGIPELIGKEYIYGKKEAKKLANMIKSIVYNKKELIKMAKNNFKKSLEFESNKLENKRNKFIKDILDYNK